MFRHRSVSGLPFVISGDVFMRIFRLQTGKTLHRKQDSGRVPRYRRSALCASVTAVLITVCSAAFAGWEFNGSPIPNAYTQSGDMSLELQCDRIRFAPAGYEDAEGIERSRGLSIRFLLPTRDSACLQVQKYRNVLATSQRTGGQVMELIVSVGHAQTSLASAFS